MKVPSRITAERDVNDIISAELSAVLPGETLRVEEEEDISQLKFDLNTATTIISVIEISIFAIEVAKAISKALKGRKSETSVNIRLANGKSLSIQSSENIETQKIAEGLTALLSDSAP
ncbi:hypothetical protein [Rhizobium leguminosarum]|uniref:hypothetical protein n=1 Tax=Rhizobium leguminosarum TaxID=384 RepID=UPI0010325526|nr:hypothetical protein [Rhizobium leguminosarum]TAX35822.1 hypothetical protein ELI06_16600 [Rhizobium leguminosarum]